MQKIKKQFALDPHFRRHDASRAVRSMHQRMTLFEDAHLFCRVVPPKAGIQGIVNHVEKALQSVVESQNDSYSSFS